MHRRSLPSLSLTTLLMLPALAPRTLAAAEPPPSHLLGRHAVAELARKPFAEWFDSGYTQYTANSGVVEVLRQADLNGLEVDIFYGTWCGDSRREVPRMLKLLDTLGIPDSGRRLIAVDRADEQYKRSPDGEEKGFEIYRVPTLVVKRGGKELSRIVEHPVLSLERDLLAILEGDDYQPSYRSYPVIWRWLREGLLTDPNVSADGLAGQVGALISSEGELSSAAHVLLSRGEIEAAVKLYEVNCSLHWQSASCHARLARAQERAGDQTRAHASVLRALRRNEDPEWIEELLELAQRTTSASSIPAAGQSSGGSL